MDEKWARRMGKRRDVTAPRTNASTSADTCATRRSVVAYPRCRSPCHPPRAAAAREASRTSRSHSAPLKKPGKERMAWWCRGTAQASCTLALARWASRAAFSRNQAAEGRPFALRWKEEAMLDADEDEADRGASLAL